MPCGATQDGRVMVERSDRMWCTGEGNGKPLQYSCLENPANSMKLSQASPKYSKSWAPLHALTTTQVKDASTPKGPLYTRMLLLSRPRVSDSLWPHGLQPPGSSVLGALQARTPEWAANSFSIYMNRHVEYVGKKRLGTRVKIYLHRYE